MRHFRLLLAAFALMLTTSTFANTGGNYEPGRSSISFEIEKMLKDSDLVIEESFMVTVIFQVTEDRKIAVQKVSSPNEEVNEFLMKRLNNRKLHGPSWFSDKIYQLPVRVESRR